MINNAKQWMMPNSIRTKLISLVLLLTLPLIVMLIYNNAYAIQVVRSQVAVSYSYLLKEFMQQADYNLEAAQKVVHDTIALDRNFLAMEQTNDQTMYHFAKIQLADNLKLHTNRVPMLESYFLYHENNNDFLAVYKKMQPHTYSEMFRVNMTAFLKDLSSKDRAVRYEWMIQTFDQHTFLFYIAKSGNLFMGAVISMDEINKPLEQLDLGPNGGAIYATDQGVAFIAAEPPTDWRYKVHDYLQTGTVNKDVVLSEESKFGQFQVIAVIPEDKILEKLPHLRKLNFWLLLALLVTLPLGFYYLRRTILLPLHRIISSMRKIQGDNLQIRIEPYPTSQEFELVNDTFNRMMEQIEDLTINVYEEQLAKQREEVQRLQLQMNPHFLMNTLNMLHSLAKVKKNELVQELSLCLIYYFRFMVRSNLPFVQLKDELEHTRNYLRIQELRYPGSLTYEINTLDYAKDTRIPPLFIQTFVENIIKHGVRMDEPIHIAIHIDIQEYEEKPCILIRIEDSGPGFSDNVLEVLNAGGSLVNSEGEHTGIWNVQRRLKLLYKGHGVIAFSNKNDSGAVVELTLPMHHEEISWEGSR